MLVVGGDADLAARLGTAVAKTETGATVEALTNGREALARLPLERGDVLVLAGELEDVPAPSVLQRARASRPDLRVILVVDDWDRARADSARQIGFNDCVSLEDAYRADFAQRVLRDEEPAPRSASDDPLRRLTEIAMGPLVLVGRDHRMVQANAAFSDFGGLWGDRAGGVRVSHFFPELRDDFAPKDVETRLVLFRRPSGNEEVVSAAFAPLDVGDVLYAVAIYSTETTTTR